MRLKLVTSRLLALLLLGASTTAQAENAVISSWNLEWLTLNPSVSADRGKRSAQDLDALASHFSQLDSDVVAFQEVDSAQAMQRIAGNHYQIVMSDRSLARNQKRQFSDSNQYTGFAIRRGVPFADPADIDLMRQQHDKLRFGAYIVLYPDSTQPLHILNVHLKAGCSGKFSASNRSCRTVREQGEALNQWLSLRVRLKQSYLIVGDFNHNLAYQGDWLWQEIGAGLPQAPQLTTRQTRAECKVRSRNQTNKLHQFRSLIDHVIASPDLALQPPYQVTFDPQQVLTYKLSDHCPVRAVLTR